MHTHLHANIRVYCPPPQKKMELMTPVQIVDNPIGVYAQTLVQSKDINPSFPHL